MNIEEAANLFPVISAAVLAGVWIFFLVIGLILNYHWNKYGADLKHIKRAKTIYFSVSGILMAAMAVLFMIQFG